MLAVGAPAQAATPDEGDVRVFIRSATGELVDINEFLEDHALDLDAPAEPEPGTITPMLIDWNQWFGCFSLNNENDVFAEYTHYWNGVPHDVRLKCGTSGWGYKHILAGHESQWQTQLNTARSRG